MTEAGTFFKMHHPTSRTALLANLIDRMADEVIAGACADEIAAKVKAELDILTPDDSKVFDALYKRLAPWDKRLKDAIDKIWESQRKIILANLKKLKKGYVLTKIGPDQILYPVSKFKKILENQIKLLFPGIVKEAGREAVKEILRMRPELHISFDVTNPRVEDFIKKYAYKFSEDLEMVNVKKLRATLLEGINAGESIPDLVKRVNETYDNWTTSRSEMIARTETIRASNEGNLEGYRQSGVVEYKMWLCAPDERTCEVCSDLADMDPIGLDDTYETDEGGVDGPPAHPRCRCAIAPYLEEREE